MGLLYKQGYFRQEIDADGSQRALYPFNDPGQLPITPVREPNGEWLRIAIEAPGFRMWVRAWQAQVGRTKFYLLDTNEPANLPSYRGITSELYGGGPDLRLKQELVLGIAGWRLLYLDELDPDAVSVELYADTGDGPFRRITDRGQPVVGSEHGYMYSARVPANRVADDYTPRIIPSRPGAVVPLEANQILWQR